MHIQTFLEFYNIFFSFGFKILFVIFLSKKHHKSKYMQSSTLKYINMFYLYLLQYYIYIGIYINSNVFFWLFADFRIFTYSPMIILKKFIDDICSGSFLFIARQTDRPPRKYFYQSKKKALLQILQHSCLFFIIFIIYSHLYELHLIKDSRKSIF